MNWLAGAALVLSLLVLLPVVWFAIQIALGLSQPRSAPNMPDALSAHRPSVCVLIPAHNESSHVLPTLQSVLAQLTDTDRVVVVADNCTDDTAEVVRAVSITRSCIEVIERTDVNRRGKGYALAHGIDYIRQQYPHADVLLVLDADCTLGPNALSTVARSAHGQQRPAQALYLMHHDNDSGVQGQLAQWAWRIKNQCRPRGLHRLSAGCQLTGTGMAFPWSIVGHVNWASGHLVEDMKLGLDFASAGYAPVFVEQAQVDSQFPTRDDAQVSQRTRWEHGHLSMLTKDGLPAVWQGLKQRNWPLFALGMDICIPPLALLVVLNLFSVCTSALQWLIDPNPIACWAMALSIASFFVLAGAVLAAWFVFGRQLVPLTTLTQIPVYIFRKIPIYVRYLYQRQMDWVRSRRD